MAKLATLVDAFTAPAINTTLWNSITGAATLDTTNDQIVLAVPTVSGTTNAFGTTSTWDATASSIYAQVTIAPAGNGGTTTALRLSLNANNNVMIRVAAGVFGAVLTTAGAPAVTTLATYDPHAHRWWRISESGSQFLIAAGPDGLNWTTLATIAYGWSATAVTVAFQTAATVTEAAGNTATIAHVNTRLGGQANPNWPLLEYGSGFWWGANGGAIPTDLYVDVSPRTQGSVGVTRGKQMELDQVRAGELSALTLSNTDGALDPTSASSPFAGHIQPFQPLRIRAQWPPTPNLLTQGVASGGIPLGTITASAALDLLTDTDATGGSVVASASAWIGANVTQFAVPNATTAGLRVVRCAQVAVIPGQPYTVQIRVRDVTASTSLQVKPAIGWYGPILSSPTTWTYGSTVTLTGSTTAGWTYLTVTGTAPAACYGMEVGVAVAATAGALCSVQTSGWQLEHGSVASAWAMPGSWSPLAAVFTEDYPAQWTMSGTYGTVSPPGADAFSLLSQLQLDDPLTAEINSHSPSYLYTLADPSGSTSATDTIGAYPAAPIKISKGGAGSLTFGNAITAASTTGVYTGSSGTVATVTNTAPGSSAAGPASFLSLNLAGIKGPIGTTYSRVIAFRYTGPAPTSATDIWTAMDAGHQITPSSFLRLYIDTAGKLNATTQTTALGGLTLTSATTVNDSNWHLAIFGFTPGAPGSFFFSLDGSYTSTLAVSGYFPTGLLWDNIGCQADGSNGYGTRYNFVGDVGFVGEFPTLLTATDCTNLYGAWRSACAGESTDARYARILRYASYTGPTSLQAGLTTSMGPAAFGGQDVVSALEDVVTTESGAHFVAADGTITFLARSARYNALTPAYTFGENAAGGEWPYEDCQPTYDSTHLGNEVEVTQPSTGQVFYGRSLSSRTAYFPRTITRTINSSSSLECQDAANYLVSRYAQPLNRITSLVLHPAANPAMWPACLALQLGTRIRVMRRPPNLPATQIDCYVENLAWSWDDKGEATLTLQCSPADTTPYAVFAAWHTTLNGSPASGVTSITVNASQDTVNPLATQMAPGQQLVLGQNSANQETVTVQSVGATSPGWTTAVLTLTAATTKSHIAGDLVCEPLPAGTTNPAAFDAASAFDASAFAY